MRGYSSPMSSSHSAGGAHRRTLHPVSATVCCPEYVTEASASYTPRTPCLMPARTTVLPLANTSPRHTGQPPQPCHLGCLALLRASGWPQHVQCSTHSTSTWISRLGQHTLLQRNNEQPWGGSATRAELRSQHRGLSRVMQEHRCRSLKLPRKKNTSPGACTVCPSAVHDVLGSS